MKKKWIIIFVLSLIMVFSLCGCQSKAEKDLQRARDASRSAAEAAERAQQNYNNLKSDLEHLQDSYDKLDAMMK